MNTNNPCSHTAGAKAFVDESSSETSMSHRIRVEIALAARAAAKTAFERYTAAEREAALAAMEAEADSEEHTDKVAEKQEEVDNRLEDRAPPKAFCCNCPKCYGHRVCVPAAYHGNCDFQLLKHGKKLWVWPKGTQNLKQTVGIRCCRCGCVRLYRRHCCGKAGWYNPELFNRVTKRSPYQCKQCPQKFVSLNSHCGR